MRLSPEYSELMYEIQRARYGERVEETRRKIEELMKQGKPNKIFHNYLIGLLEGRYDMPPLGR